MGLSGFEGGEIILTHGHNVVTVPTNAQGKRIWLSIDEPTHAIPVCCGELNVIGAKLIKDGFVLCADIKTDGCIVQWFIEF
jgi:hypothetical protein